MKRNRETTLQRSLKVVRDAKLPSPSMPRVVQHQSAVKSLEGAAAEYEEQRKQIDSTLRSEAKANDLPADLTIKALFDVATIVPLSDDVRTRAELRKSLRIRQGRAALSEIRSSGRPCRTH